MKQILILILILFLGFAKSQTQNSVSQKDIYDVINYFVKNRKEILELKKMRVRYLVQNNRLDELEDYDDEYDDSDNLDKFFSKEDLDFMKSQINQNKKLILEKKKIKKLKLVPLEIQYKLEKDKNFWKNFYADYGMKSSYMDITIPIFSVDRNYALIEINKYCGGTCGFGERLILKKENNQWKTFKVISGWKF